MYIQKLHYFCNTSFLDDGPKLGRKYFGGNQLWKIYQPGRENGKKGGTPHFSISRTGASPSDVVLCQDHDTPFFWQNLPYLPITAGDEIRNGFKPFSKALTRNEGQTTSSKIQMQVTNFISYEDKACSLYGFM